MSFLTELKRRNVLRLGAAYIVGSWLLIQVAETIFPLFGFGDTPARIIVLVLAIAFVPSLIIAWAFQLTPEGLKWEVEVDREHPVTNFTGKTLDKIIMVLLALGLGYFAFDKFVLDPVENVQIAESAHQEGRAEALTESYGDKSIAVLPFVNMSADLEQEYFSDGISEELLNLLAKIPELRVISRSSAFSFKGKDVKLADVGRELNVAHILEGSVRKAGNQVRITAQLIEARSDTHLWSVTYDRELDDIFAVQDDIAINVVEKLKLTLLGAVPQSLPVNPDAYALYLRANHLRKQSSPEALEEAIRLYLGALDIAPDFVAAWDRLGALYCIQTDFGLRPPDEGRELCSAAINKALAIDPNYPPALSSLAWIAMRYDLDFVAAAGFYQRALELDPTNVAIIGDAAVLVQYLGQLDEAIRLTEYASALDPVNPMGFANLGVVYRFAGRIDEALEAFRTAESLSPDRFGARYQMGIALLRNGQPEAALEEFEQEQSEDWKWMGIALASHALGKQQEFETAFAKLRNDWGDRWPGEVAQVYSWIGDADQAFLWLKKAYDESEGGDGSWPDIRVDDLLAPLHDDPRWPEYVEKFGISAAVIDKVEFSVTLPD